MKQLILLTFFGISAVVTNSIQSKILNGENAVPGQFPWMVSLRVYEWPGVHQCGGAIVTPEHVVTAAHCIFPSADMMYVVTGHVNNFEGGRNTAVAEIRPHPNFPHVSPENDVGILKLATQIEFNAFELPIPIAAREAGAYPCRLSGWGVTTFPAGSFPDHLQTIILHSMTNAVCHQNGWGVSNAMLCAGGVLTEGACFYDSGSPLVCHRELAGVVSTGDPCGNGRRPDLFGNIFHHRDWLLDTIAETGQLGSLYSAQARSIQENL